MTTIPAFTSVPGQLVPGMGQPALIANEPLVTTYPYYGHMILYYLDYLDVATGHTLVALPGGSYLMTPVNSRRGLTVPPPDGRWNPGTVRDLIVFHPAGSAAWDRDAHRRRVFAVPVSLRDARAAIGPGPVPPPLVPQQREAPAAVHPAGSAAWDREAHRRRAGVAPQPSLAVVRARIEAAKAERGFWDTEPARSVPPAPVAAQRVMPPPEPTELQRIRAALAAKAAAV